MTPHPQEYIITEDEMDYWQLLTPMSPAVQELRDKIRSRPHPTTSEREILEELRAIVVQLYDNGFKNPMATFDGACQIFKQRRQHQEAGK